MSADETNRQHPDAYLRRPTFCDNENYPNGKYVYVKELCKRISEHRQSQLPVSENI